MVREIETLVPARMALLADRRRGTPYGLAGGGEGSAGRDMIVRAGVVVGGGGTRRAARLERIKAKGSWELKAGDRVRIETPGGGGHGRAAPKRRRRRKGETGGE